MVASSDRRAPASRRGTKLALTPVVLHVSPEELDRLLSEEHPELALVATWAVSHRHGPKAKKVVERAIELTERPPLPLQKTQRDAILNLLSERMLAWLKEKAMNPQSRLSPARLTRRLAGIDGAQTGSIGCPQTFGGSVNVHPHLHTIAAFGVFEKTDRGVRFPRGAAALEGRRCGGRLGSMSPDEPGRSRPLSACV